MLRLTCLSGPKTLVFIDVCLCVCVCVFILAMSPDLQGYHVVMPHRSDWTLNQCLVCVAHQTWTLNIPTSLKKRVCGCRRIQIACIYRYGRFMWAAEWIAELSRLKFRHCGYFSRLPRRRPGFDPRPAKGAGIDFFVTHVVMPHRSDWMLDLGLVSVAHQTWTIKIPTSLRKIFCNCRCIRIAYIYRYGR